MRRIIGLILACSVACAPGFAHTVETQAPVEDVWELWSDVHRWPQWDTELESATLDGPFAAGSRGQLKAKGSPSSKFVLSEVEPLRGYAYDVKLPLSKLTLTRSSTGTMDGLSLTHHVRFRGALGWFFSLLLKPKYKRALPEVMESLVDAVEAPEPVGRDAPPDSG